MINNNINFSARGNSNNNITFGFGRNGSLGSLDSFVKEIHCLIDSDENGQRASASITRDDDEYLDRYGCMGCEESVSENGSSILKKLLDWVIK